MTKNSAIVRLEWNEDLGPYWMNPYNLNTLLFSDAHTLRDLLRVTDYIDIESSKEKREIKVWKWEDAPQQFRDLSPHGGDEDWVALIPSALANAWIPWCEDGTPFGVCNVSEHQLDDGSLVRIGAHA